MSELSDAGRSGVGGSEPPNLNTALTFSYILKPTFSDIFIMQKMLDLVHFLLFWVIRYTYLFFGRSCLTYLTCCANPPCIYNRIPLCRYIQI